MSVNDPSQRARGDSADDLQEQFSAIDATFGAAEKPVTAPEALPPVLGNPRTAVRPPGKAGPAERGPDNGSKTRWDAVTLQRRAEVICVSWARISSHDVALADAERMARLSMPLAAIVGVMHEVWATRTGIGLAWPRLRDAEKSYLAYEADLATRRTQPQ